MTKGKVKISSKPAGDAFSIAGFLNLTALDPSQFNSVIRCEGYTSPAFVFLKKGEKYTHKGANVSASLDFAKGKFKIAGKKIDFGGPANPIHVEIQIGHAPVDVLCWIDLTMVEKLDKNSGLPKGFSFSNKVGQAGNIGWED